MIINKIALLFCTLLLSSTHEAVEAKKKNQDKLKKPKKNKKTGTPTTDDDNDNSKYIWTKAGLEQIPWKHWRDFQQDPQQQSLYVKDFPFPGDAFTFEHFEAWIAHVLAEDEDGGRSSATTFKQLLKDGVIAKSKDKMEVMKVFEDYQKVPTLFSDPMIVEESPIDYRMQYATDIGSHMIGESAARGRLVNPAGRRLREHFYRFPDQCDATPIALEVFLRLMM